MEWLENNSTWSLRRRGEPLMILAAHAAPAPMTRLKTCQTVHQRGAIVIILRRTRNPKSPPLTHSVLGLAKQGRQLVRRSRWGVRRLDGALICGGSTPPALRGARAEPEVVPRRATCSLTHRQDRHSFRRRMRPARRDSRLPAVAVASEGAANNLRLGRERIGQGRRQPAVAL